MVIATMNVVLPIPDDLAEQLGPANDLARRALEALAVTEYQAHRLTEAQLRRMLGFETRYELHGFLRDRGVFPDYKAADLQREREVLQRRTEDERKASDELVEQFRAFAARHTLGGLAIKELISEGRR